MIISLESNARYFYYHINNTGTSSFKSLIYHLYQHYSELLKTIIEYDDYRNTPIKARSMWLGIKKDGERLLCIKDCERYLVSIIIANYMLV